MTAEPPFSAAMVKRRLKSALTSPHLARIFHPGLSCLMYHRVVRDDEVDAGFCPTRGLCVTESDFRTQMEHVSRHYDCLSIGEAISRLEKGVSLSRAVVVTFDDGYLDNRTVALPILKQTGVPATIYVTTDAPDGISFAWWFELEGLLAALDEGSVHVEGETYAWRNVEEKTGVFLGLNEILKRSTPAKQTELLDALRQDVPPDADVGTVGMLTWQDIQSLDGEPLVTIGAHTCHHHPMAQLTHAELIDDLAHCADLLRRSVGHDIEHFAYPYGSRTEASTREFLAVEQSGFRSAVTTRFGHWQPRHRDSIHALPRVTVTSDDTLDDFRLKLNGFGAFRQFGNPGRLVTD